MIFYQIKMFKLIKSTVLTILIGMVLTIGSSFGQIIESIPQLNKDFQVVIHFVHLESTMDVGMSESDAITIVNDINPYFSPINASFTVCETYQIENYQYEVNDSTKRQELLIKYGLRKKINIFLIHDSQIADGDADLEGVILDEQGVAGIFIVYNAFGPGILVHEMGHFMGLEHTFEGSDGTLASRELVDGSNCETAGDLVCDTPADPYVDGVSRQDYSNSDCVYSELTKDLNGDFYTPHLGNIMSYYTNCAHDKGFTDGQFRRMVEIYLQNPHRW